jgi:hypothetical protein
MWSGEGDEAVGVVEEGAFGESGGDEGARVVAASSMYMTTIW